MTHLALVGPTASGKSALALRVAEQLGDVEIVSIDSMQVYRGLDIGTAKPSAEERARVPHHLIDLAGPSEDWSVARFQEVARAAIAGVEARGRRALLVGGTGLYLRAVIDPLRFPPECPEAHAELLEATSDDVGLADAYAELAAQDPVAAARIRPDNRRRIVRALAVLHGTGERFSSFGVGLDAFGEPVLSIRIAGVWLPRTVLAGRIADRARSMRAAGLVDEVRGLAAPGTLSRTAGQAIGYQEVLEWLRDQQSSLDAVFDSVERRTRRFARRQRMWFRRDPRITWFASGAEPGGLVPGLLAHWSI